MSDLALEALAWLLALALYLPFMIALGAYRAYEAIYACYSARNGGRP